MPFLDALAHRATPVRNVSGGIVVEGQRVTGPVRGTPFDCVLFLPQGRKESAGRGRRVREPTLLYAPEDDAGVSVALSGEDELLIVAPELNLAGGLREDAEVLWRVAGDPQPFGKPGADVIGFQVALALVED